MKKLIFILLLISTASYAQYSGAFGQGGSSVTAMLPIIADSSAWIKGTHVHSIKPQGGKSIQADSAKLGYLNVTGDTQLDGNLTMNTVASESLKVLAGGIRNEGGLRQKGLSQFGATGTPVYITTNGKLGIGTSTSSPYNAFGMVSAASGRGTGIGLTSAQWNKNRTSWATASDTSAIGQYIDSAGGPRLSMKAVDGDSLGITLDGAYALIKSTVDFLIYGSNSATAFTIGSSSAYFGNDTKSLGASILKWQNYYGSDNIYLGGKGQTATMTIGTQNTMTEQTDSTLVMGMSSGNPYIKGMSGYAGQSTRQFYFGADTLALFNGARTGRDSTVYVLPNGTLYSTTAVNSGNSIQATGNIISTSGNIVSQSSTPVMGSTASYLSIYANNAEAARYQTTGKYELRYKLSSTDSLDRHSEKSVVADDGTITLATGVAGWGEVMAGDNEQWAHFRFSSDGTVTLIANSALVSKTAAAGDDSLMVYDAGSGIAIKNRLGATKKLAVDIKYFAP